MATRQAVSIHSTANCHLTSPFRLSLGLDQAEALSFGSVSWRLLFWRLLFMCRVSAAFIANHAEFHSFPSKGPFRNQTGPNRI